MGLTRREHHIDGIAERIDEDVNFGAQSAAGSADRLLAVFFVRPRWLVSAHDGGVDHHISVVVITRQQLENAFENAALGPAIEALIDDLPMAKALRQIAPRDTSAISVENRFNEQPIVRRSASDMAFAARQKIFDPIPLVVT